MYVFLIVVFPLFFGSSSFAFYYRPSFWEILLHTFLHLYLLISHYFIVNVSKLFSKLSFAESLNSN